MSIEARGSVVALDATSLIVFAGFPERAIYWTLQGEGTITILTDRTDEQGRAYCVYAPDANLGETVIIGATYGS